MTAPHGRKVHNIDNHETKAKVEQLAGYIRDDGYIAGYLGISREEVARIRRNMPPPGTPRELQRGNGASAKAGDFTGFAYETSHATSAERGSASLLKRINAQFRLYAVGWGIAEDQAMRLLMNRKA